LTFCAPHYPKLTKQDMHRARKVAAMSEEEFQEYLARGLPGSAAGEHGLSQLIRWCRKRLWHSRICD
jgi:hypothetical protein